MLVLNSRQGLPILNHLGTFGFPSSPLLAPPEEPPVAPILLADDVAGPPPPEVLLDCLLRSALKLKKMIDSLARDCVKSSYVKATCIFRRFGLTERGLVMSYGDIDLSHHWLR